MVAAAERQNSPLLPPPSPHAFTAPVHRPHSDNSGPAHREIQSERETEIVRREISAIRERERFQAASEVDDEAAL